LSWFAQKRAEARLPRWVRIATCGDTMELTI
jgi:hypothetical protein